jgi:nucleoside-diphosphate-sugar epimerase
MKNVLILGGNGFIGHHLARRLKLEGCWVRVVDIKEYEYGTKDYADEYVIGDLRNKKFCETILTLNNLSYKFDEVYNLAFSMGGAGYIFTGDNDLDVMSSNIISHNMISLHNKYKKIFYSSSACIYPQYNQLDPENPKCSEDSSYPAEPDSEYGWTKLFDEHLYLTLKRLTNVDVKIARFHNIFGTESTWQGGREKSPAAFCRKILMSKGTIDMWGDGQQTRSYLYIDECIDGIRTLMNSDKTGPYNIGSEEMISMDNFAKMIMTIENKNITINHITGPTGVRGRNSDNNLIKKDLNWSPSKPLIYGITKTYEWIKDQIFKINTQTL